MLAIGGALWLSACASPKPELSLEERAKSGDPVASCQILVTKLQSCAEDISRWKAGGSEPSCSSNRLSFNEDAHVDEVLAALKSDPSRDARFGQTFVRLAAISLGLEVFPVEESQALLGDMEKTCPSL